MPDARSEFLNVDLEVYTERRPRLLIEALAAAGAPPLHTSAWREGGYFSSFELRLQPASAERACSKLAALVRALPAKPLGQWDSARRRVFSIGIQAGAARKAFAGSLRPSTVRAVAALGAELEIVVYAPGH